MSLSDYLKLLRAKHGGVTPLEIQEATGVPFATIGEIETKYRRVGDDDAMLAALANYFSVPLTEMQRQREQYRKKLTAFLSDVRASHATVCLTLINGEVFVGTVAASDKLAIRLKPMSGDEEVLIQRHAVDNWEVAGNGET